MTPSIAISLRTFRGAKLKFIKDDKKTNLKAELDRDFKKKIKLYFS